MSFLPIVERELRVASRRRMTFWSRMIAGALSVGLGVLTMLSYAASPGGNGKALLFLLGGFIFCFSLIAALFTTADCVSRERREGTLGFLFLTNLRGFDVVLGKFVAASLTAVYGVLAALPVLGISLLMGGVTAGEFWRVVVALLNALFFALAIGIWVSCRTTDDQRSLGRTVGALLLLTVVAPLAARFARTLNASDWIAALAWLSPASVLLNADNASYVLAPSSFWSPLLTVHAIAWLALVSASLRLPKKWREPETAQPRQKTARAEKRHAPRAARRRRLLDENPVSWLIRSRPNIRFWAWVCGVAAMTIHAWFFVVMWSEFSSSGDGVVAAPMSVMVSTWLALPATFGFRMLFGWQACRFLADARHTGGIDLLLSTPLSGREILGGQWRELRRLFLAPGLFLVIGPLLTATLATIASWGELRDALSRSGGLVEFGFAWFMSIGAQFVAVGTFVADLFALGWLGMWMALTVRKPQQAAPWTLACVLFFPMFVACIPMAKLAVDIVIIIVCRSVLLSRFREKALPNYRASAFVTKAAPPPPRPIPLG